MQGSAFARFFVPLRAFALTVVFYEVVREIAKYCIHAKETLRKRLTKRKPFFYNYFRIDES